MADALDTLTVRLGDRSYPIFIRSGLLSDTAVWQTLIQDRPFCIVSNETLAPYVKTFLATLRACSKSMSQPEQNPPFEPEGRGQGGQGGLDQPSCEAGDKALVSGFERASRVNNLIPPAPLGREHSSQRGDFLRHGFFLLLKDGEEYKNLDSLKVIFQHLTQRHFPRSGLLIALGGGVVGDLTGFAAATYQRGIDFIQVPTTLLAMVDSSVGGKTAVNFGKAKNHIGSFHQPIAVLSDINTLTTLPDREYAAGLAEVLKYGLIWDKAFFDWLMAHSAELKARDPFALKKIIVRSCEIKATIVERDEREIHLRMFLNFGHTFGHAIEAYSDYQDFLHGEAVALGILYALEMSIQKGMEGHEGLIPQVKTWYQAVGLPTELPAHYEDKWMEIMRHDKKKTAQGGLRFILLSEIGKAYIHHE